MCAAVKRAVCRDRGSLVEDRPTLAELEQRYINLILQQEGGNKSALPKCWNRSPHAVSRSLERGVPDRSERFDREPSDDKDG